MKFLIIFLFLFSLTYNQETIKNIIHDFNQRNFDTEEKNYPLKTLGYITPWKKEGYLWIEKYAKKFDMVSPCWFELKPEEIDGEFQMIIDSGNNVDSSLMKKLREKNPKIEILPRLHCPNLESKIFQLFLDRDTDHFITILERRIKYSKLDGFVLDCINFWSEDILFSKFSKKLLPKIKNLMIKMKKKFIVTAFPYSETYANFLDNKKLSLLAEYVDYINIMTYDYSGYAKNQKDKYYLGPLSWIKQTMNYYVKNNAKNRGEILKKILFGIPFHGNVFETKDDKFKGNIDSNGFLRALEMKPELCELVSKENEFDYYINANNEKIISYPIGTFIQKRLELSQELGLGGCGIWELGNSNDYLLSKF